MTDEIRIAIIVNPALPLGLLANTAGAISIGLGARVPALAAHRLTDRHGRTIDISSSLPVPILQAPADTIRSLLLKAMEQLQNHAVVPFPAFARSLHDYRDYEAAFPDRDLAEEEIDGLGLAGPSKWIKSLTGSLKLLR
ncbi:Acyl-CoA synthetase/AMP-acid ligase [Neorhizobium galegae bv. orientalis]|nr:Acyl-CoA synthetase/AMP-acid ligase [Neorhizobium galegae bv. orientalis]